MKNDRIKFSLKKKISILAFSVLVLMLIIVIFGLINEKQIIDRYDKLLAVMITEGETIYSLKQDMLDVTRKRMSKPDDKELKDRFTKNVKKFKEDMDFLKKNIYSKESLIIFDGLSSTIEKFLNTCNEAVDTAKSDQVSANSLFEKASKMSKFINENTTILLAEGIEIFKHIKGKYSK